LTYSNERVVHSNFDTTSSDLYRYATRSTGCEMLNQAVSEYLHCV